MCLPLSVPIYIIDLSNQSIREKVFNQSSEFESIQSAFTFVVTLLLVCFFPSSFPCSVSVYVCLVFHSICCITTLALFQ